MGRVEHEVSKFSRLKGADRVVKTQGLSGVNGGGTESLWAPMSVPECSIVKSISNLVTSKTSCSRKFHLSMVVQS